MRYSSFSQRHLIAGLGSMFLLISMILTMSPKLAFAQTKPSQCPQRKLCPLSLSSHPLFAPKATTGALSVNSVYTRNANGNVTSNFTPGAGIQYVVYVTNSSGNPMTTTFHYSDYWGTINSGTIQIEDQIISNWTIPVGLSGWFVSATVPTDALPGPYTDRVFVWDQNNYQQNQDTGYGSFTIKGSVRLGGVPYYTQYYGQPAQNHDCGPASVAMVLKNFGRGPGGSKQSLIQVRSHTGNTSGGDTGFIDLENALSYYGSSYSEIPQNNTPAPDFQIMEMAVAIKLGQPVIGLINAFDFGRSYNGHWLVVTGFSSDGTNNYVFLNDPDNQNPRRGYPHWIKGGAISVLLSTFKQAEFDAAGGPYGIVVTS